jgi:hypothetical protein
MGGDHSRKAQVSEGMPLLSEALIQALFADISVTRWSGLYQISFIIP